MMTAGVPAPVAESNGIPTPGGVTMADELQDYPDVLTPAHLAAILHTSEPQIIRLLNKGELPGRKVGGRWKILKSRLIEFLSEDRPGQGEE